MFSEAGFTVPVFPSISFRGVRGPLLANMYGGHGPGDDPGAGLVIGGGKDDVSQQTTAPLNIDVIPSFNALQRGMFTA